MFDVTFYHSPYDASDDEIALDREMKARKSAEGRRPLTRARMRVIAEQTGVPVCQDWQKVLGLLTEEQADVVYSSPEVEAAYAQYLAATERDSTEDANDDTYYEAVVASRLYLWAQRNKAAEVLGLEVHHV